MAFALCKISFAGAFSLPSISFPLPFLIVVSQQSTFILFFNVRSQAREFFLLEPDCFSLRQATLILFLNSNSLFRPRILNPNVSLKAQANPNQNSGIWTFGHLDIWTFGHFLLLLAKCGVQNFAADCVFQSVHICISRSEKRWGIFLLLSQERKSHICLCF
jgi:hypothetical protein